MEQLQSHIWVTASSYMRKIFFAFFQCYGFPSLNLAVRPNFLDEYLYRRISFFHILSLLLSYVPYLPLFSILISPNLWII
jgi:hypothetical protein